MITEYLPGLDLLKTYQARWLAKDVVAGLVLSALLMPQGMAYAGLPAVTGFFGIPGDQRIPPPAVGQYPAQGRDS